MSALRRAGRNLASREMSLDLAVLGLVTKYTASHRAGEPNPSLDRLALLDTIARQHAILVFASTLSIFRIPQ